MFKEIFWLQRFLKIIFCEYKGEKKKELIEQEQDFQ